jgi:4,5:9,10-diseco-3-hydroxy-5,9,17-trioxoandrosta-1(10),2-diene-4-oate hydrolase
MESLRSATGASPAARRVTVDGVGLAVDDQGRGPAIVCLHAIGHGAGDFAALGARLAPRWRVIAPDWPGQGRSDPDRVPPSAARYAELLGGLLDACAVDRAVLLGNSIGGAAAIRFAAAHPERVSALVLENPGGLDPATDALGRTALAAMVAFFAAGARGAFWFPAAFAAYYRLVLQRAPAAAQRQRIVAAAREIAPLLRDAWTGFGMPAANLTALPPTIRCPVLVAWAARDQLVQLRRCRPALARFPDVRLETFPAGHAAHLETPAAFDIVLDRFLKPLREELPVREAHVV